MTTWEASQNINVPVDSTPYPYELGAASHITESMLIRALAARAVIIEQPAVPQSLRIVEAEDNFKESHVEVIVAKLQEDYVQANDIRPADRDDKLVDTAEAVTEKHVIRAKYVLGCDGARSWVRKAVNITVEGETTGNSSFYLAKELESSHIAMIDLVWGVVDFTPEVTDFPTIRAKNIIASPLSGGVLNNSACVYIRLQEDPNTVAADETQKSASKDSQGKIIQSVERVFLPYTMRVTNITWCNEHKGSQRVASAFSTANQVFLLGDAGEYGANGAMTDACNLAWKLAYVLHGRVNASILDTYEAERRAQALGLIQFDQDIFDTFRPETFSAEAFVKLRDQKLMFLSGLEIHCQSQLTIPDTEHVALGLSIGERAPWVGITRLSDWNPSNLLDLMAYNGHFKLIFLPGDTRVPSVARLLITVSEELVESLGEDVLKFIDIFTLLNIPKETSCDNVHLPPAFRIMENVYVDKAGQDQARQNGRLYESLKIRPGEGAAIIVRPDGITAMVAVKQGVGKEWLQ
ncbi:FAD/NAD(P)-binding domain-containing protein [Daedalea quercina L-15889]|uniref:FAD/NAD(P)-binding domain-containing protein n=1 Tax=Daedalea quercina L-15889 TaxID=1314783 RepID=A0A165NJZ0_9APHY|nr:FAD/NAD(P)-binding domain-containing protein [Daedalea quercina L-15889]